MAGKGTPAIVAAERAGIAFTVHEYAHDPRADSYGLEAAEALGQDPARVFKTLVVDAAGDLTVCVVPVAAQLDLGAIGKRTTMAPTQRAERVTGIIASPSSGRSSTTGRTVPRWLRMPGSDGGDPGTGVYAR